jgi:L,D-peptidoglycan transpeptidase YkuD (ErfK/YbiS/YcfS/YnhG family)
VPSRRNRPWFSIALGLTMVAVVSTGVAGCGSRSSAAPAPSRSPSPSAVIAPVSPAPVVTGTAAPTPAPAATPVNLAARLRTLPAATTQVLIVHGDGYATTYATVEAYQRSGGAWQPALPPMTARIGQQGFTDAPTEGVPATPTGVYPFGATFYGNSPNPGVHFAYHQLVVGDYWDENVSSPTYNTFVHGADPGGASEPLWESPTAYSYFAFIAYNVPAVAGKGSAMFLHQSLGTYTAGCVALPRADLLRVLTWLDPAASPRIVMAPDSVLSRY